jgi:Fe-S cluster assembly protein SufD
MARNRTQRDFSFTPEMVRDSESVPPVLREYRQHAWQAFQQLPLPTLKDEAWRRTSLQGLNLSALKLAKDHQDAGQPEHLDFGVIGESLVKEKSSALLTPRGITINRTPQLEKDGVILTSLTEAAGSHPELVAKVLGKIVSPEEGKFAAVTAAFAEQGLFIYIPRGVEVKEPILGLSFAPGGGTASFFHTLIYLDEGASLTYIQETLSPLDEQEPSLTGENLEILVGPGARLRLTELQSYGYHTWSFGHKKALVERDGNLEWDIGAFGSALCKHFISVDLIGQGAEGRVSGLFFADREQHLSYNTLQRHLAPWTTSDLLFKGALKDKSRTVWRGMIYVAPGAQHIDGYQANRNLVLDPDARSDSIPGLEILNNDVRCTHGSTVGKVDPEQLFYLRSRGIPPKEAEELIIQGFFEDVLSRFALQEIEEGMWQRIKTRLLA